MTHAYFTPAEVAELLRLNVATVYQAIKQRHLEAARLGNRYRISREQLDAWLAGRASTR